MSLQLGWTIHILPLWFLVFALFLPRLALLVYWLDTAAFPFHVQGWIPLVVAIVFPRLLVLYLIYMDQGVGFWFVVHLIAAVVIWASGDGIRRGGVWSARGGLGSAGEGRVAAIAVF